VEKLRLVNDWVKPEDNNSTRTAAKLSRNRKIRVFFSFLAFIFDAGEFLPSAKLDSPPSGVKVLSTSNSRFDSLLASLTSDSGPS
jgi:hypothetical protein